MKRKEGLLVFGIGALGYSALELLYRRRTHWSMALAGGTCLTALYAWNKRLHKKHWTAKCAVGATTITAIEFLFGLFVNRRMQWGVWDYTDRRYNVLGQICPFFSFLWFLLCIPLFPLCAFLEQKLPSD